MKEITTLPESIPGLPVVPDDYGPRSMLGTGRKTLIKQPPPKKAQQQFEKTWAKPGDNVPQPNVENGKPPNFAPTLTSMQPPGPSSIGPSLLGVPLNQLPKINQSLLGPPMQMGPPPPLIQQQTPANEGESWRTPVNDNPPPMPLPQQNPLWRQPMIPPFQVPIPTFGLQAPFAFEQNKPPLIRHDNVQNDSWKTSTQPPANQAAESIPKVVSHGLPQLDPRKRRREGNAE